MKVMTATALSLLLGLGATQAMSAEAVASRAVLTRQIAAAFADGSCAVLLEKDVHLSAADGTVTSRHLADNATLHRCQYVHEMAINSCLSTATCPTYEAWSARNPLFNPSLPREAFLAQLEARQKIVSVLQRAPGN
jgi:hypothetical protein